MGTAENFLFSAGVIGSDIHCRKNKIAVMKKGKTEARNWPGGDRVRMLGYLDVGNDLEVEIVEVE